MASILEFYECFCYARSIDDKDAISMHSMTTLKAMLNRMGARIVNSKKQIDDEKE